MRKMERNTGKSTKDVETKYARTEEKKKEERKQDKDK